MSPLEISARALEDNLGFTPGEAMDAARVVLQAIREPSELQTHTVSRILEKRGQYSYQSSAWVWKTMIDAALGEG